MKEIFPQEILSHTTNYFLPKNSVKSKMIYGLVLALILCALCALPLVTITVFTSASGFIKASTDRMSLTSINSGQVFINKIKNNQQVKKGDTVLVLQTSNIDEQIELFNTKLAINKAEIGDLSLILNNVYGVSKLSTPRFRKEIIEYKTICSEHLTKIEKLKIDFKRNFKLLSKGVIAKVEYENSKLEYDLAKNALARYQESKKNTWQTMLIELENQTIDLANNLEQAFNTKRDFVITAPLAGNLINAISLNKGSFINAGTTIAEITPNTELIAECYITPRDIGLIDRDKNVRFQIDALNYNQWGMVTGNIIEIADDVEYIENRPFYRIRCRLNKNYLQLKNGYQRNLGKGMTLNARFEIAERTLFDLLYDKVDDWLNPANANKESIAQK